MPDDFEEVYEGIIRDLYRRASEPGPGPRPDARNYLIARDGKFLGKLTSNRFDAEGVFNQYGPFGSQYSSDSIFNRYGPYGSEYSTTSPWNPYASDPPRIYLNNVFAGNLTKNRYMPQAVDPDDFLARIENEPQFRF